MITQSLNFQATDEELSLLFEVCQETGKEPKDIFVEFLQNLRRSFKVREHEPNTSHTKQPRQAGALAHLNIDVDDSVFFEPMSDEELAWWNGDKTDKYGISL